MSFGSLSLEFYGRHSSYIAFGAQPHHHKSEENETLRKEQPKFEKVKEMDLGLETT